MSKISGNKMRILRLYEIFKKETDEQHTLTVPNIIEKLHSMGIEADRRSIYDDIEVLQLFGADIIRKKSKTYDYYMGQREFELPELKLLVDAVQASKFITKKKSEQLISKIEELTSSGEAKQLDRQVYIVNRVKTMNESIYYNIDELHRAISSGKQISFKYSEYTIDKKMEFRRNGEAYIVSPYMLAWENENYYLVGYYEHYGKITHFRVDKMSQIKILDTDTNAMSEIDAAEYARKTFGMFPGEDSFVMIRFHKSLIGVVIDRFGKDVSIFDCNGEYFTVRIHVSVSDVFLSWVFQFGNRAQIISPQSVVDRMKDLTQSVLDMYE